MDSLQDKLTEALLKLYKLDFVDALGEFLNGEHAVLFNLSLFKDSAVGMIGQNSNISKSRMSAVIKTLLRKKLILIKSDLLDKRKKIMVLTKMGEEYINKKLANANTIIAESISKLGANKTMELIDILNYMVERL